MANEKKFLDQTGVQYLWSQLSLHDYPNNETLIAVINAIDETKADKTDVTSKEEIQAYCNESVYGIIDGNIENISNSRVNYIRDYMFYQHENLKTVSFPEVTDIKKYSFYKCPLLVSAVAPKTVTIEDFAFKDCENLQAIDYPIIEFIGQGAFDGCSGLTSANFSLVETIEPLTFRYCENLANIDLNNVITIKTQAFYNCGVTQLFLRGNTVCTLENVDAFYFTPVEEGTGYIYVPSDLVDSYRSAENWSVYANQIQAIA